MGAALDGIDSIVGQQKWGNEPFVNESTHNSSTPENPVVVMAKIVQSSQLVGVIDILADTNSPLGHCDMCSKK